MRVLFCMEDACRTRTTWLRVPILTSALDQFTVVCPTRPSAGKVSVSFNFEFPAPFFLPFWFGQNGGKFSEFVLKFWGDGRYHFRILGIFLWNLIRILCNVVRNKIEKNVWKIGKNLKIQFDVWLWWKDSFGIFFWIFKDFLGI